jgi:hypothetical protein
VVPKKMNRVGGLLPTLRGFFFAVESPTENGHVPSDAPVSPAPKQEEIGSHRS